MPTITRPPVSQATSLATMDPLSEQLKIADDLTDSNATGLARMAEAFLQSDAIESRVWCALFSCWMRVDPTAGWRFANRHRITAKQANLPLIALEQWAAADPTAARQIIEAPDASQTTALVHGMLDNHILSAFKLLDESWSVGIKLTSDAISTAEMTTENRLMQLAALDPQQAILWAQRFNDSDGLGAVVVGWMSSNAGATHQWLSTRADAATILSASAKFISNHRKCYRPDVMDAFMDAVPPGNEKLEAIVHAIESLAEDDPDMAIKESIRLLDDAARPEAFAAITRSPRCDFEKAWNLLKLIDSNHLHIARMNLPVIESLADGEAHEIGRLNAYACGLIAMQDLAFPEQIKADLIADMLEVDQQRALRLLDGCSIGETTLLASNDAFDHWFASDPEDATAWFANQIGNQGDSEQVFTFLNNLDLKNEALLTLARPLPSGTLRTALEVMAYQTDSASDPLSALRAARQSSAAAFWVEQVYVNWAQRQPAAALQQLPDDANATADIWNSVVSTTMISCPNETLTMIDALPDGEFRDAAILGVVAKSLSDPVTAAKWALVIGNEKKRHTAMEMIFTHVSLDLHVIGNRQMAATLRTVVDEIDDLSDEEHTHWIERINREFGPP